MKKVFVLSNFTDYDIIIINNKEVGTSILGKKKKPNTIIFRTNLLKLKFLKQIGTSILDKNNQNYFTKNKKIKITKYYYFSNRSFETQN